MSNPTNQIQVFPFSSDNFFREINRLAGRQTPIPTNQMDYLFRYLEHVKASCMIVEDHYIDRHYIDEYAAWYAKCLNHTKNFTGRIHIFSNGIINFDSLLKEAASGNPGKSARNLEANYLGYIVVRPLPSVPIGRTVLKPWPDPSRAFPCVNNMKVHLAGIDLKIDGLPFQQQDMGVGACATTAVWSALQRVAKADGLRAPTPPEITTSAFKYYMPEGRPDQTPGFTPEQIAEAIRSHGFTPHCFKPYNLTRTTLACLYTYLESGIPIILAIFNKDIGHAVTAVGYQLLETDKITSAETIEYGNLNLKWVGSQINKIYIHDDRLGPYARANFLFGQRVVSGQSFNCLGMSIDNRSSTEEWEVAMAWVPLYPKLRRSALGLIRVATQYLPTLSAIAPANELTFETKFRHGGKYAQSLYTRGLDSEQLVHFMKKIAFSRYIGVLTVYHKDALLCEFVLDTTDTDRSLDIEIPLALLCLNPKTKPAFQSWAEHLKVPFVT